MTDKADQDKRDQSNVVSFRAYPPTMQIIEKIKAMYDVTESNETLGYFLNCLICEKGGVSPGEIEQYRRRAKRGEK